MKFCINCGKEIKEDAKFCPYCGAQQPELAEDPEAPVEAPVSYEAPPTAVGEEQPVARAEEMSEAEAVPSLEEAPKETPKEAPTQPQSTPVQAAPQREVEAEKKPEKQVSQQLNEAAQATKEKFNEFAKSDTVKDLRKNSLNYFSYLHQNIKSPNVKNPETTGYFGLVNFILISLFTGLGLSRFVAKAGSYLMGMYSYYTTGQSSTPAFAYVLEILLGIAAVLFIYVVVYYVFVKIIYKQDLPFLGAFERIFSASSLAVYVSVAAFLMSFITSAPELFLLLLVVDLGLVGFNFAGALWTAEDHSGKANRYYATVLAFLVASIITMIVFRIFFGIMIDKMTGPMMNQPHQDLFEFGDFFDY